MNGVRSTFMRRGYLLTALSAAVLLAASPPEALAQGFDGTPTVTIVVPQQGVTEGDDATITVRGQGTLQANTTAAQQITVALQLADKSDSVTAEKGTPGQIDDALFVSNPTVTLTFQANNTGTARMRTATQTVTLRTNHDADAEDEVASIEGTATGDAQPTITPASVKINDDETQTYKLTLDATTHTPSAPPKENGEIKVKIDAEPAHFDDGAMLTLYVLGSDGKAASGYTATGSAAGMAAIGNVSTAPPTSPDTDNQRTITIATPQNDKNRGTDTITLEADSGSDRTVRTRASLDIDVVDIHQLPLPGTITAVAKDDQGKAVEELMEGGDPIYLTVTVDRSAPTRQPNVTSEDLTVTIRTDDPANYEVSPSETTVSGASAKAIAVDEIKIAARNDENVNDDELVVSLVVSGDKENGSGESIGTFKIAVVDDTAKKVSPKSEDDAYGAIMTAMEEGSGDEGLNPGESFMVETSDLFDVMDGYSASYGVAVEGDPAVSVTASTDSITVDAKSAGESKVTVTATAKMASSTFMADQSVSNVASITFPVTVVDRALVVMLEQPDGVMGGNIVEGMSYDIKVMANRMVHEDTEVMIMRDRAESDADDDDFTVSSATIMAGYDSATAELMVTEDMEDDAGHGMGEQLVLYGMYGDGEETNPLTFTIWDEAVPALPLIGQLLLALFLMAGGARLYRRRQS